MDLQRINSSLAASTDFQVLTDGQAYRLAYQGSLLAPVYGSALEAYEAAIARRPSRDPRTDVDPDVRRPPG
jgi:hypothetical protein